MAKKAIDPFLQAEEFLANQERNPVVVQSTTVAIRFSDWETLKEAMRSHFGSNLIADNELLGKQTKRADGSSSALFAGRTKLGGVVIVYRSGKATLTGDARQFADVWNAS